MKILTAMMTGLILNSGFGAAMVSAQDYTRYERSSRYSQNGDRWRAERTVRGAYREILGREPDRAGLQQYTDAMLNRDWSESDVRRSLLSSSEYRELRRGSVGDARAAAMVRRAYLEALGREPDPASMRRYTMRVMRDGWTESDIRNALRDRDGYRDRY